MPLLSWTLLGLAAVTQATFMVGAATVFDVRTLEPKSRLFAVGFVTSVLGALGFQSAYPRNSLLAQIFSMLLLVLSLRLFFWAAAVNRQRKLTAVHSSNLPDHLVASGPYAYVRHPFYTAYIVAFLASALASNHFVPSLCALFCFVHYFYAARAEEQKFARSNLAAAYEAYRARTGMFVPRL